MTQVFLLAGQSNMEGAAAVAELPAAYRAQPARVRLFEAGAWQPLVWRERFGPEVGFAHAIGQAIAEEPIVLCKFALGGANLYYDWNPDGVSRGEEDSYRGPLYPQLLAVYRQVCDALVQAGERPTPAGVLWMQGERDSVFAHMARAYADNLRGFIRQLRQDLQAPALPFLIGQVAPRKRIQETGAFVHAYREIVQASQAQVAADDPHTALVPALDLPQFDDLHFDAAGQLTLGQRYAEAYRALMWEAELTVG